METNKNNLSKRFFGNKIFLQDIYKTLTEKIKSGDSIEFVKRQLSGLFKNYEDKLIQIDNDLLPIFKDFLYINFEFCDQNQFDFSKTSALIEISQHVFQISMEKLYNLDQSFNYFKELIVRHALFRPPHSILIFNLDEIKLITNHFLNSFYKHYNLYITSFTPSQNLEIRTFEIFKSNFPFIDNLKEGEEIKRSEIPILQEYLIDKETGLTPEQLEEIMRGDSIHMVPASKKEEWLRLKQERQKKAKIDRAMNKELERLNKMMEEIMKKQDEEFFISLAEKKKK